VCEDVTFPCRSQELPGMKDGEQHCAYRMGMGKQKSERKRGGVDGLEDVSFRELNGKQMWYANGMTVPTYLKTRALSRHWKDLR
jgi:hypothetical protein